MDEAVFWRYVALVKPGDQQHGTDLLIARLASDGLEAVKGFGRHHEQFMGALYNPYCWGAGYLINLGFLSDDGFLDFRGWILAQGRKRFYDALLNADSIAAYSKPLASFEAMTTVTMQAYGKATGDKLSHYAQKMGVSPLMLRGGDPSAKWHHPDGSLDVALLQTAFPRLWAVHGAAFVAEYRRSLAAVAEPKRKRKAAARDKS